MTIENQDIDDGLTDEERAALADDGDEATESDASAGDELDADEQREAEAAADADATKQAAEAAATDAATNEADAAAAEAQPQQAPILVAPDPEDAEAKLTEIATRKDELLDQFDNGDITAREYQKQLDDLAKQERAIERAQDRAELAAQMDQQRLQNEWVKTCNDFVASHDIYTDNPRLYKALDAEVRELAGKPETAQWSGQKFLEEAHKNLKAAFGFQEKTDSKRNDPQQRELPPNLAKVPAADVQDTSGGRFAVLDRMANTDPVGYEEALAKMSQAERDAYLNA